MVLTALGKRFSTVSLQWPCTWQYGTVSTLTRALLTVTAGQHSLTATAARGGKQCRVLPIGHSSFHPSHSEPTALPYSALPLMLAFTRSMSTDGSFTTQLAALTAPSTTSPPLSPVSLFSPPVESAYLPYHHWLSCEPDLLHDAEPAHDPSTTSNNSGTSPVLSSSSAVSAHSSFLSLTRVRQSGCVVYEAADDVATTGLNHSPLSSHLPTAADASSLPGPLSYSAHAVWSPTSPTSTYGTVHVTGIERQDNSASDRALRKRRRQQAKDTRRRHKQNSGFIRLQQLLSKGGTRQDEEQKDEKENSDDGETDRLKLHKADLLQRTAARIEELERKLAELNDARCLRAGLISSHFVHSSACVVLTYVPSGVIADASERYLAHAGFERSLYVGRRFLPPYSVLEADPMYLARPSTTEQANRVLRKRSDGELEECPVYAQYAGTVRLLGELYRSEVDVMEAVWRTMMGDGLKYESHVTSWVSEWEQSDGDRRRRQPLFMVSVVSSCDRVCIE